MSKKIVLLTMLTILLCSLNLIAQQESAPILKLKYKISDYKNQNEYKKRYALTRFSDDDSMFAVIGDNDRIVVYETESGKVIQAIKYGRDKTNAFSFGKDGRSVLFLDGFSFGLEVWDLETGERRQKIEGRSLVSGYKKLLRKEMMDLDEGLEMSDLPLSPDGKSILIAKTDYSFDIVDLGNFEPRFSIEQTTKNSEVKDALKILFIPGVANTKYLLRSSKAIYSSDGKRILMSSGDRIPTLWNAETGKLIAKLGPQKAKVYKISFSPDGKLASTIDKKGVTQIWNAESGENLSTLGKRGKGEMVAVWSPNSDLIMTFSTKQRGRIFDARTGKLITETGKLKIRNAAFSADGKFIAILNEKDKSVLGQIFNVADGNLIATLPRGKNEERPLGLDWNSSRSLLAISSAEYVKVFNEKGELLRSIEGAVYPARFSNNGNFLLTGGRNDDGFIWEINDK